MMTEAKATQNFTVQKHITDGQKQRIEVAKLQRAAEKHVAHLEVQLSAAEAVAKDLRKQAKSVTEDASKEARTLQRMEDRISTGQLPVSEGVKAVRKILGDLSEVEDAQRRLLGLQMGGSVDSINPFATTVRSGSSESDNEQAWHPHAGEVVLVCMPTFAGYTLST